MDVQKILVENSSLILEGGTFRTIYTAGVLDALLEEGIIMPYVAAISAGAINAVSYMSLQPERTKRVLVTYRNDGRYMGVRNFLKEKSIFGLDFAYNVIPNELDLFDWDAYYNYPGKVEFGVTNAYTGKAEYMNALEMDKQCQMLRATCALPLLFPEIKIGDVPYYDGGLADSIPLNRAIEHGFDKHLIILTRPKDYVKTTSKNNKWITKLFKKRYPKLVESMNGRADNYNVSLKQCLDLEEEGKAFIFKPDYALNSFESKVVQMEKNYEMGYRQGKERMPQLKQFLGI